MPNPPQFLAPAFDCPHCNAYAEQRWQVTRYKGDLLTGLQTALCVVCKNRSVWLQHVVASVAHGAEMVWPAGLTGPAPVADMPEGVASIYTEARAVAGISPRSASALLRLALEGLLTDLYPDEGNLNDTIGAARRAGLPDQIINAMDVLRFNGNAAIHELSREDDAETAASLFAVLNLVVTRLVTEPRQIAELHAELPAGVLDQIERRDAPKT